MFSKVLVFGDEYGLPILLDVIPSTHISAIVLASNRNIDPQFKKLLEKLNFPILTQPKYNSSEYLKFFMDIKAIHPDSIFCNSYSMLIRNDILNIVNYNAFNIHASYLPFNRGPNPIQWAIIKGHSYTGVTIHRMDADFDTGQIVEQIKIKISFNDTWLSLKEKISMNLKCLCQKVIPSILLGNFTTIAQNEQLATKNIRLTPSHPKIDFERMSNLEIYNLIRAQIKPLAGAYLIVKKEKIHFDHIVDMASIAQLREHYWSMDIESTQC